MKNYILNILNDAIKKGQKEQDDSSYDIAFLKEIIEKVTNTKEYFYTYVLDLDDDLIKELTRHITPEEKQESLFASIIYLKNLCEINKKEEVEIPLSENQEEILYQLLELIKGVIKKDEKRENSNQKNYKKYGQKYEQLLNKLKNEKEISIEDYDLIEELILKNEKGDVYKILNDVVDYLNSYNYRLFPKNVQVEPEIEISEDTEEVIIKGEKQPKEEIKVVKKSKKNNKIDIFKPQSFVLEEEPIKPKKRNKNKAIKKEIEEPKSNDIEQINQKDPLSLIGISHIELNEYCINLLNEGLNEDLIPFYNETIKPLMFENNYNSIISILCLSDLNTITNLFNYFKEINLSQKTIKELLNRATQIFFTKNKNAFENNVNIINKYNPDLNKLIELNITYFYNTPEYNQNKINILEENGINISKVLEIKPQILAINIDKILKNIDLLNKYNLTIKDDEYDSISIISSPNLNIMIDTFIEAGFSTYFIHDGLRNIRSLIIKRIFYAFKNNLNVWNENYLPNRINPTYEEWINKERRTLTEDETINLFNGYPLLEYIESSKRPIFFTDVNSAQIRRKYEFKFGNNVISRLKVYSIFNVLVNHNVFEKEALFYAITYNSNLNSSEYEQIKNEILRK